MVHAGNEKSRYLAATRYNFEIHKNEPPLDTYKTGQIFHISPPRFIDVVKKRLELSLKALEAEAPKNIQYATLGVPTSATLKKERPSFCDRCIWNCFNGLPMYRVF